MRFNVKIKRLIALSGKIQEKTQKLKARILPDDTIPKAEITPVKYYDGKWHKRIFFSGIVKQLDAIYRFLAAKARIVQTHEAKANSAPAVEIEADSTIQASKEAQLSSHPAKAITVDQKERLSVSAKLVAYRRAGLAYIKKLFFRRTAKLQAAPGAVAKYIKAVKLKRTSKAIAAESAIMESRFNKVHIGRKAAGSSAPAQIIPETEVTVTAKHTATAIMGTAVDVNINHLFRAVHHAPLYAWFLAEQNGNILSVFQAFSGIQSGNVLEIDLEEESAYWANATVMDGTLNLVFAQTEPKTNNELKVI